MCACWSAFRGHTPGVTLKGASRWVPRGGGRSGDPRDFAEDKVESVEVIMCYNSALIPTSFLSQKPWLERKGRFSQFITQTLNPDTVQDIELGSVGTRKMTREMFAKKMRWEEKRQQPGPQVRKNLFSNLSPHTSQLGHVTRPTNLRFHICAVSVPCGP